MRNDGDPAASTEILSDGLGVMAAAAAFQTMKDHQCRGTGALVQLRPVGFLHPSTGGGSLQLRIALYVVPINQAVGEQAWPCPVEIQEVAVWCVDAFSDKGDAVMADDERPVQGLRVSAWQPRWNGAG